jgi:hypothetical protein
MLIISVNNAILSPVMFIAGLTSSAAETLPCPLIKYSREAVTNRSETIEL